MKILILLCCAVALNAQSLPVFGDAQKAELLKHYRALVQIDTTAGNETKAVEYLKKVIEAEGIATKTFAVDPARANLVARLKGNGSKRPLLLMAHTDVVRVQREKWPVDPFGAVMKDGYIWGRGSVDDKPILATELMTFLMLKRGGVTLDRDVIFFAESGEEGESEFGAEFMAREHFDELDAEYALTEGGGGTLEKGRVATVQIQTTEKSPKGVRLIVNGTSGHASVPRVDNALVHLSSAVSKVGAWETPMRLNDTTRSYLEKLATISTPEKAARYNGLLDPRKSAGLQRYFAQNEPGIYSMLRTSISPTILKAGVVTNVIPSEAEATLDIRALPDEDINKFYDEMKRVIGDPAVKVEPTTFGARPLAPPSKLDNEMYKTLEAVSKRLYPGVTVLPSMSTGATDMAFLRAKGVQSYGIGTANNEEDRTNFGAHSDVERMAESSLYRFADFEWQVVTEIAGHKTGVPLADLVLRNTPPPPLPVGVPQQLRVGGNVQAKNIVSKVSPVYPPDAKAKGIQGTVMFEVTIATDGTVKDIQLQGGPPSLVPAASEALKQWVYKPTLLNGVPEEVVTRVNINFTLLP